MSLFSFFLLVDCLRRPGEHSKPLGERVRAFGTSLTDNSPA